MQDKQDSMNLIISHGEFGVRPQVTMPSPDFYSLLGEEGIRKLVSDHYNMLVLSDIKHLFPAEPDKLEAAKKRSADFFVQICGGRDYYNQSRGKPMMAKRHQPFRIDMQARVVWLNCYRELLPKLNLPESTLRSFWNYLNVFSLWMVNTP